MCCYLNCYVVLKYFRNKAVLKHWKKITFIWNWKKFNRNFSLTFLAVWNLKDISIWRYIFICIWMCVLASINEDETSISASNDKWKGVVMICICKTGSRLTAMWYISHCSLKHTFYQHLFWQQHIWHINNIWNMSQDMKTKVLTIRNKLLFTGTRGDLVSKLWLQILEEKMKSN